MKKILALLFISLLFTAPALGEEVLSKGDAVALISAADFVKQKIGDLFSWTIGYDISRVNRVKLVPSIRYITAVPKRIPPDGRTILELYASVEDPEGLTNISGVRADLSDIGKLPNMMLVDNGLWGDKRSNDGVYSLQSSVNPAIPIGNKEISVAVVNKKGWLALSKTTIFVDTKPQLSDIKVEPFKIKADASTQFTISLKVENPGRQEDLKEVYANLNELGQGEKVKLEYKGEERFSLTTVVPTTVDPGIKKIEISAVNVKDEIGKTDWTVEVIR